jgi:hypothetical protein
VSPATPLSSRTSLSLPATRSGLNTALLTGTADRIRGILTDPEPPVFVSVHEGDEVAGTVVSTALCGINLGSLPADLVPTSNKICAAIGYRPVRDFVGDAFA